MIEVVIYAMQRVLRSTAKVLGFFIVVGLALFVANGVMRFKYGDGIEGIETFRTLREGSVDVLCLGSSRTFENINTGVLWDEYGMAAFDLAGSIQPLWDSYYYLEEALKTQRPKVIVLEVYSAVALKSDYSDQSRIIKNTFGIDDLALKLEAKKASSPPEDYLEYALEFPHYHGRYADLTKQDFLPWKGILNREHWKGSGINLTSKSLSTNPNVTSVVAREPLLEKSEVYLEKLLDLADEVNIPVVLVLAPYPIAEADQQTFNTVADMAKKRNIPFLNYNLMFNEGVVNFTGDDSDLASDGHLNYRGCVKFTKHVGAWLSQHYDIPDHRGDDAFFSWQIDADNNRAVIEDQSLLVEEQEFSTWIENVSSNDRFTAVLCFRGNCTSDALKKADSSLKKLGLAIPVEGSDATFVLRGGALTYSAVGCDAGWYGSLWQDELMISSEEEKATIRLGNNCYNAADDTLTALLYDDLTGKLIEVVSWDKATYTKKSKVVATTLS